MAQRVARETIPLFSKPSITITGTTDRTGQSIGDIAGSRLRSGHAFFRVTSAVSSEGGTALTAVADTTIEDFDDAWAAQSFDYFDLTWQLRTFTQFAVAPLAQRVINFDLPYPDECYPEMANAN